MTHNRPPKSARRACFIFCCVFCAALACLLLVQPAAADSPLGELYSVAAAYRDIPEVKAVARGSGLTPEALAFLMAPTTPTDQKFALITALEIEGGTDDVTETLVKSYAGHKKKTPKTLAPTDLNPEDLFVIGIARALETGTSPKALGTGGAALSKMTGQDLLAASAAALPADFTVHYARALADAQANFGDFCKVYKITAEVPAKFDATKRNLRPAAFDHLNAYLQGYAQYCTDTPEAAAATLAGFNEIYRVVRVGPHILTATQSGAVVWNPADPTKPIAIHAADICSHAVTRDGQAWIGCQSELLFYDGKTFKGLLKSPSTDEPYPLMPVLGPKGEVRAYQGTQAWRVDVSPPTALKDRPEANAYDIFITPDGSVWWIDFMSAIHNDKLGAFPTKSPTKYPGRDPRRLVLHDGTLYALDFEDGVFRFDPSTENFVGPVFPDKQIMDIAGGWMLRYRQGPTQMQKQPSQPTEIDLSSLGYMRSLLADPDGTLWVAGWTALARVAPDGSIHTYTVTRLP